MKTTIPPTDRYNLAISGVPQGKIYSTQNNNDNDSQNKTNG